MYNGLLQILAITSGYLIITPGMMVFIFQPILYFSFHDNYAGKKYISNPLNHNPGYNKSISYSPPHGTAGVYYVFVYTDKDFNITGEVNRNNNYNLIRDNNGQPKAINFIELPSPDLAAISSMHLLLV